MIINYIRKFPFLKQIIKFCIVGGFAAIINFSIYYSFTEVLRIWYVYSAAYAFVFSAIFNFITNKLWTFRNKDGGFLIFNQAVKFSIVMVLGLLFNTSLIYAFTEFGGFDWRLSWVFATGLVTFWSFTFNRFWTFRKRKEEADLSEGSF